MATLDSVPGAGLLVDGKHDIVDCNNRCPVVFKSDVDSLCGKNLEMLRDEGYFESQTLESWKESIDAVQSGTSEEENGRVVLSPVGSTERYHYDLWVTPSTEAGVTCCSLRSVGTSQRYDETITALHVATRDLMTAENRSEVLERVATAASDVLGFPGTAVRTYDPETEMLRHVAFGSRVEDIETRPPYTIDDSPHGRAFERGETIIDDIEDGDPYDRGVFTQTMYTPIGRAGLLSVGTVGNRFNESDVQFAEILAENAAAAIKTVETAASLRRERRNLKLLQQILTRALRHNIRNDLTVLRMSAKKIGDETEDHPMAVENMLEASDNIQGLSEKTRDIERVIDTGATSTVLDLSDAVAEGLDGVTETYPDATIHTQLESCQVRVHPELETAVTNIVENACEHVESPDVTVSIDTDADTATLEIRDDGPGIPEAEIEVLESGQETDLRHGSGLGLWIVKLVVDKSDGDLDIDAGLDGTTVRLTFQRVQ